MNKAFISIGSNIGDRKRFLKEAIDTLNEHQHMEVRAVSSLYETAPVGYTDQSDFLNVAVAIETSLTAHELLAVCQSIEQTLGRERTIRWGPRTVDLDILLFNDDDINTENLIVPHPRMHERGFVLIPLLEIDSDLMHPVLQVELSTLEAAEDDSVVLLEESL